jgi:iron complex transport system ATP-binding protein
MIRFAAISARYAAARVNVLTDIDFVAAPGQVTALVGPNGSGKSTLVRLLLRRLRIMSGSLTVGGDDITRLEPRERARRIAVLPQREVSAFPMRVRDYIALGRLPHLSTWSGLTRCDADAVASAAARAGVESLADRVTDQLSGGEWQGVRLARALAQQTPVLVLDEPTAFLDIGHEMALFERLAVLAGDGHTVLIVSHQLNLVARFATTMVLLRHGRVEAAGSVESVMRPEVLERVYEWPLVVTRDPAGGAPALTPLRVRA